MFADLISNPPSLAQTEVGNGSQNPRAQTLLRRRLRLPDELVIKLRLVQVEIYAALGH